VAVLGLGSCALVDGVVVDEVEAQVVEITPDVPVIAEEPGIQPVQPVDPIADHIAQDIARLDLRSKLAGLMMVTVEGVDARVHREFIERLPAAGFLFLANNLRGGTDTTRAFVQDIQQDQLVPLLISVDQEGSPIARISGDAFPGALVLGGQDVADTTVAFQARQELVASVGANLNFGVVADVSPGRVAYIHDRSFSTDPVVVSDHVVAALGATRDGVGQTLKHFPGHGLVVADSHREIARSSISVQEWRNTHAVPFVAGIASGVDAVMMAHIRVDTVSKDPASLSNEWVDILRFDLGFDGVIITDDLSMLKNSGEPEYQDLAATAVAALVAGNDLLLVAVDPSRANGYGVYDDVLEGLVDAVSEGLVSIDQVERSLERILLLRHRLAGS